MRLDQLTELLPSHEIERPKAWTRATISPDRWTITVPPACVAELDTVVAALRAAPRPIESLAPAAFSLRACSALMSDVRAKLVTDTGLAVVDRIPVERYSAEESRAIGWLLAAMLGLVVAQKVNGTRLYDVRDTGQALGYGVRRSVTNLGQPFHTDGGWLWKAPNFVGLFCLESALEGGLSRFASLVTAHNALRERRPDLLARLYTPFPWDRQGEHAPDASRFSEHPVFEFEGGVLSARYYEDYVLNGYRLAESALDDEGREALEALRALVDEPAHWVEFRIEKGQLQYLNNRQFAHSRTAFKDAGATGQGAGGRHMLRLWNRDEGSWHLEGRPAD
jgi:alpha-ketoglutarate-dependent taurine dioxygenase